MNAAHTMYRAETRYSPSYNWAGYTLGFAVSGFFDGILLHQILQWHHLLSGLQSPRFADLRIQVMADGLFHAVMYVIGLAGLYLLYRARADLSLPRGGRRLLANFWIGFGVWHVLDAVLSHWITRIHRIRMDSDNPLLWDLAWLIVFGLIPLAAGWWLRRRPAGSSPGHRGLAMGLAGACLLAGTLNLFPLRGYGDTMTVVMRPGQGGAAMLAALKGTGARIAWTDRAGAVWVLAGAQDLDAWRLYRHGAMYVAGQGGPAGCAAWLSPKHRTGAS
ncbi:DUF2243 domain-containing protein [Bordetella genomosp. 9]|uniref:DUF2243 domain-containing protein n=1 Tax=Bordetella genomosp. 9 TaxID=1416803 RepID=A0A1W6YXZ3_9BORD|nr:DUF2243 domain-containing protein [Bordetella genomosp. 9]ARP85473.1 hypothetical protein CAL13_04020 [Bordetella genomosp. 9]